ncbi:SsgA family sporulation/cell division regulator [Streptomyces sp. NPDC047043]|uniref:SsgA family sporulation/cell division regulator n=1 Tax=Streptomyces sp. NPDC047043 TaxID=3154497 RepID=UPI00340EE25F
MKRPDNSAPVVCRILVRFVLADESAHPVPVDLTYDPSDPYAVSMAFHVGAELVVQWVFARDLLLDGQHRLAGAGDVQVWPSMHSTVNEVCVGLRPCGEGEPVVLAASAHALDAFLRQTLDEVPAGTESEHMRLDDLADHLLDRPDEPHR